MPPRDSAPGFEERNRPVGRRSRDDESAGAEIALVSGALLGLVERASCGVLILDARLRVIFSNPVARASLKQRTTIRLNRGILVTTHPALLNLLSGADERSGHSVSRTVRVDDDRLAIVRRTLLVTRVALRRRDDPQLLLLNEPRGAAHVSGDALRDAYSLTASECLVVDRLVSGRNTRDCARDLRVTVHTVRSHLQRVFVKCDVKTQAELVRQVMAGPAGTLRRY